jgi:multiple sugar transport system permease protein
MSNHAVPQSGRLERTLRIVIIVVALIVALVPLLSLLASTFKPTYDFFSGTLLPQQWTLANYQKAIGNGAMIPDLIHSLIVTTSTTVISTVFGTLAAFGLSRLRSRWVVVVTLAILAVRFYPKIAGILPYYLMMRTFGLIDTLPAVILAEVSITLPVVMLIMITFFGELPVELDEAAALDGCTVWQSFFHVILPLVRAGLATAAILTAMVSWNEFLYAASVTSTDAATLPVLIASFTSDIGTDLGQVAVVSTVVVIPIALFILATQRHLVRGLTLGAVKD